MTRNLFYFLFFSMLAGACREPEPEIQNQTHVLSQHEYSTCSPTEIRYARGFTLDCFEKFKRLRVYSPWKNSALMETYVLAHRGVRLPDSLLRFTRINTPVKRTISMSATHVGALLQLGLEKHLVGVDELDYLFDPAIVQAGKAGRISEVGNMGHLNIEKIIMLEPDLMMLSTMENTTSKTNALKDARIPFVMNVEWQETHPLAKAEWIKYIAAFYDKEPLADSLFRIIEQRYLKLAILSEKAEKKPRVLMGSGFKGTWHVPAGESFAARFLKDAGARYDWGDHAGTGSIPLSLEVVMERSLHAGLWLNPSSASSLSHLKSVDERYGRFDAFQQKKVYNNNARANRAGGNDYWESGTYRPDLILADLIHIMHPQLLPDHQLIYYQQLPDE